MGYGTWRIPSWITNVQVVQGGQTPGALGQDVIEDKAAMQKANPGTWIDIVPNNGTKDAEDYSTP